MTDRRFPIRFSAATTTITPALGDELAGYPFVSRPAASIHDELLATAIVVGEGAERAALIFLDLIAVGAELVALARAQIERRTGIDPARVLVSVTHTHSGPSMPIGDLFDEGVIGRPDASYVASLPAAIADAVARADQNAVAGSIGFAWGEVEPPVGGNRRVPGGASDPRLPVIGLFDASGAVAAIVVSVACHPTVLQADNIAVTGDLAWGVRAGIAERFGASVVVGYATGAAGDQSTRATRRAASFDEARRLGDLIAAESARLIAALYALPVAAEPAAIRVASGVGAMPLRALPTLDQAITLAAAADAELERLRAEPASEVAIRTAEVTTFGAHHTVRYARRAQTNPLPELVHGEIQAFAIGPARVIGVPVELFVELGLAVQEGAPGPRPMIVAYANDLLGYAPTRAAFAEGGYEPAVTLLGESAGEALVETAGGLLAALERRAG